MKEFLIAAAFSCCFEAICHSQERSPILSRAIDRDPSGSYPAGRIQGTFDNGFRLKHHDVVALLGSTQVVYQGKSGHLETLLTRLAKPDQIFVYNLGWESDTVYRQQRPLNFGSHLEHLRRIDATVAIMTFGQMEVLDGLEALPQFISAYQALIDEVSGKTERIVLVTPRSFTAPSNPHIPDLTRHNAAVSAYAEAIAELAASRDLLCVDLSSWVDKLGSPNGIHLTERAHWDLAFETVSLLTGSSPISGDAVNPDGSFTHSNLEAIRKSAVRKHFLWQQNWRPSNWAFAYGDRQHVPSSHDHRPGYPRWMPKEIDSIIALIELEETRIAELNQIQ